MADIKQTIGSRTTVTASIALDGLAPGSAAITVLKDLGNPAPMYVSMEMALKPPATSFTGNVEIYTQFSLDGTNPASAGYGRLDYVARFTNSANIVVIFDVPVIAQHAQWRVANNTSGSLSTGNTVAFYPVHMNST